MRNRREMICIKPNMIWKLVVDIAMTVLLLLLMPYELIGQAVHEWIGIAMFALFILHHILNRNWSKNLFRGKYVPFRIVQTIIVVLVLCAMAGSMVSGVILSRHVLSFLPIKGGRSFARNLHMISAYWGFVFMSLHIGLHWRVMVGMAGKVLGKPSSIRKWAGRMLAFLISGYGIYAFAKRDIGSYMFLKNQFVFFDFEEPLAFFLLDYMAVMGLLIGIGHYCCEGLKRIGKGRRVDCR